MCCVLGPKSTTCGTAPWARKVAAQRSVLDEATCSSRDPADNQTGTRGRQSQVPSDA
jgi:hypothetical protein